MTNTISLNLFHYKSLVIMLFRLNQPVPNYILHLRICTLIQIYLSENHILRTDDKLKKMIDRNNPSK